MPTAFGHDVPHILDIDVELRWKRFTIYEVIEEVRVGDSPSMQQATLWVLLWLQRTGKREAKNKKRPRVITCPLYPLYEFVIRGPEILLQGHL